jgi:hypothetical protein
MDETRRDELADLKARLDLLEQAVIGLHERTSTLEAAVIKALESMQGLTELTDSLHRRLSAALRQPPAGPMPPLSNMN